MIRANEITTLAHGAAEAIYPQSFSAHNPSSSADLYLRDPLIAKLAQFFNTKGLAALKDEDQREHWYQDWIDYQAKHKIYAALLSPKEFSSDGAQFNLLRYCKLLEVFAYFSPAHGYSLQVTFLGLFVILMGDNEPLKREAVASLESGGLFAFGISEKEHGSDLFANEFTIKPTTDGDQKNFIASGRKYYIGNSNVASIISILARKDDPSDPRTKRIPFVLFALRPDKSPGFRNVKKIRTLGVRAAHVGEFEVKNHPLPQGDIITQGRGAWDALFGTVTLGKFFLGFGSIGICERAFEEALAHLTTRILYNKPVIEMPHIRANVSQAYARLLAMKLYAYRALDYVHAANEDDRRYLLFNAVQKAKVSTEGVKLIALLSECVGARGLESDTFFEMALRDAQLVPGLEGSTHINFGLAAQFAAKYFARHNENLPDPKSLLAHQTPDSENSHLMQARTGSTNTITFAHFLKPYAPLIHIQNVRTFARQVKSFQIFLDRRQKPACSDDSSLAIAHCFATIAYAQLIAENAKILSISNQIISTIFHCLISDFTTSALTLSAHPTIDRKEKRLLNRLIFVPTTPASDWDFIFSHLTTR